MNSFAQRLSTAMLCMLFAISAGVACSACSNSPSTSSAAAAEASGAADESTSVSREDVEAAIGKALESQYDSVRFSMKTESTATGAATGQMQQQQQVIETTTSGELNKAGDDPAIHLAYMYRTNTELGVTKYDMYVNKNRMIVSQDEQLFANNLEEGSVQGYISSVTTVTSQDEVSQLLDVANNLKMTEEDGEKVITITADPEKLADSNLYDASNLPEGSKVNTLVANYTIDADDHFKTVRLMSSTTGTPTYRVTQTYRFSDYNETQLPEWPDLKAYIAKQVGIQTDANGRMFLVDDNGQTFYVNSIDDDGTIHFDESTSASTSSGGETTQYYYYYDDTATGTQSSPNAGGTSSGGGNAGTSNGNANTSNNNGSGTTNNGSGTGNSTSDRGRAYITGYDGTVHYLDEEGSEIRDLGGTKVFIDKDGEWYFLSTEEGDDYLDNL